MVYMNLISKADTCMYLSSYMIIYKTNSTVLSDHLMKYIVIYSFLLVTSVP